MNFQIKQTDSLSEAEYQHLFHWGEDIFGADSLNLRWRPKTRHFLLYEGENLVSHVGVLRHTISVGDLPVKVGGVGGVVTLPTAQKKGYARILMRNVAEFFERDWQVEAGLLFCLPRMVRYYENLGWRKIDESVFIEQTDGVVESPIGAMVLPFNGYEWRKGKIELKSLPW
jgi:aminoglycoside 2'-N-acetyltransferase I